MILLYAGPMFIVFMLASYKKLRSNRALIILSIITFFIAIPGLLLKSNGTSFLTGAFTYTVAYAVLRHLYIGKYSFEPTYNRSSWYDQEEGRKQNWFDVIVFVMPLLLSFAIPIFVDIAKSKM